MSFRFKTNLIMLHVKINNCIFNATLSFKLYFVKILYLTHYYYLIFSAFTIQNAYDETWYLTYSVSRFNCENVAKLCRIVKGERRILPKNSSKDITNGYVVLIFSQHPSSPVLFNQATKFGRIFTVRSLWIRLF